MNIRSIGLVFAGALGATVAWHAFDAATAASNADTYKQLNLFGDVFDRVRADYVEPPNEEQMIEAAINGMLSSLDPHSSYMNTKKFQEMQVQTDGKFIGLGIEVTKEPNGFVKVVSPIDGTPAAKAGLMANDLIVKIDGAAVQDMNLNDAVDKMRGRLNTSVTLSIVRNNADPFDVKLVREEIKVQSVKYDTDGGDIGYIRISSFTALTQDGLDNAIKELKKKLGPKLKGYVVDLRNDPGGLLDQAISVSDTFLDRGEIVSMPAAMPTRRSVSMPARAMPPMASRWLS